MTSASMILGPNGLPLRSSSAYDASTQSKKRAKNWYAPNTGPNTALVPNLRVLRNRALAAYRNSPFINNGIEKLVANEVGTGIAPESMAEDQSFRDQANQLWDDWVHDSDADGVLNFYGQEGLAVRSRLNTGNCLVRLRVRRRDSGLAVPLQLQLLEADYCPTHLSRPLKNGNNLKAGKEINGRGKVTHYWLYKKHPSEYDPNVASGDQFIRVPASQIIHHYIPLRPGQLWGEPITVQSLLKNHTLESYDDAELVRKESRSGFTGAITKPELDSDEDDEILESEDEKGNVDINPGTFFQLLPGEGIELFDSDKGDGNYAPYMRNQLLSVAAGLGIPYEMMTGDYSDINDRVIRAILNEFHRAIEMIQNHITIHQICRSVWNRWLDIAVLSGAIQAPGYSAARRAYQRCEWSPQAWPYVHPQQDVSAAVTAINNKIDSRDDWLRRRGRNPRNVDKNIVKGKQRLKQLHEDAGIPLTEELAGTA